MGGVDVNVQQRVCVECHTGTRRRHRGLHGDKQEYIEPGLQHLDGRHALWYARSRAGSDDFSRMRRQRCVAGALMEQADPVGLLQSYPQLAKVVKDNVSIDIPRDELSAWVDLALRIQKGGSIRSLPLTANVVAPRQPRLRQDPRPGQEGPRSRAGGHVDALADDERQPHAHAEPLEDQARPRPRTPDDCVGRVARRDLLRPRARLGTSDSDARGRDILRHGRPSAPELSGIDSTLARVGP